MSPRSTAVLLMMDTVPLRSDYDHGVNYLRIFIHLYPSIIWLDKPVYGRISGSRHGSSGSEAQARRQLHRPSIGIMGATPAQRRGRATFIVMGRGPASSFERGTSSSGDSRTALGSGLVGSIYYNAWTDDGRRRPAHMVLLQLRIHHSPDDGVFFFFNKHHKSAEPRRSS